MLKRERGLHFDPPVLDVFANIAQALYETICCADETNLERMLTELESRYFFVER